MFSRLISALVRAMLVALLIAVPALMLPGLDTETAQTIPLIAMVAAVMTFGEYFSTYPSIIEFRDAPPFNRLRFASLFVTILLLSVICRGKTDPSLISALFTTIGMQIGGLLDFAFSPVRLAVLMLPETTPIHVVSSVRTAAGLAYALSLMTVGVFFILVRFLDWPTRSGAFNVWVNLPLFDPTAGGDVLSRLRRDARVNIALGFLLPFLIPAIIKAASDISGPLNMANPHTLIWTVSIWAILPTSLIMRGTAMIRLAGMIEEKRRRVYAKSGSLQPA